MSCPFLLVEKSNRMVENKNLSLKWEQTIKFSDIFSICFANDEIIFIICIKKKD
jgi:hypothetical protein